FGLKATIKKPRVSEEAKISDQEPLENMETSEMSTPTPVFYLISQPGICSMYRRHIADIPSDAHRIHQRHV
ncbi:hypothetical protein C0991_003697, partial [Blastosporella zonata]